MADVLDLRQFRAAELEPLLRAEAEEWRRELHWNYSTSLELIRQYLQARILPGYVLIGNEGRHLPKGYGFFVYESHKALVGAIFAHPRFRSGQREEERALLRPMLATLQATPGLQRIEAQLMPFRPPDLAEVFAAAGFQAFRRLFMHLDLEQAVLPAPSTLAVQGWETVGFEEAASLITDAYAGHIDSAVNDQYRSYPGALRFLHNVIHYPGCGSFDALSSCGIRDTATTGRSGERSPLLGMLLVSRVKSDVAHITQVCVHPRHRHRALGRALFAYALASLRRAGLRAVTLTVTQSNENAVALYEHLGFKTLREFDAYVWNHD